MAWVLTALRRAERERMGETMADGPASSQQDLFCVRCGYNQRGIVAERCPECGLSYGEAPPSASRIPWVHRRHIGAMQAYWRTAFMVMFRKRALCDERGGVVEYGEARRFWEMTLAQAYGAIVAAVALVYVLGGKGSGWEDVRTVLFTELYTPVWPAVSIVIGMMAFLAAATGLPSYFCHPRRLPVERQNRAIALSYFASAPWALLPGVVLLGLASGVTASAPPISIGLGVLGALGIVAILLAWWYHTAGVVNLVTERKRAKRVLLTVLLLWCWLVLGVLLLVVLPATLHLVFAAAYAMSAK